MERGGMGEELVAQGQEISCGSARRKPEEGQIRAATIVRGTLRKSKISKKPKLRREKISLGDMVRTKPGIGLPTRTKVRTRLLRKLGAQTWGKISQNQAKMLREGLIDGKMIEMN